jgi:hypothetical protein
VRVSMVGRISCFSAFRTTPKKHSRNERDLQPGKSQSLAGRPGAAQPVGQNSNLTFEGGDEIPGGLAGIRERMAAMGHFVMAPEPSSHAPEEQPQGPGQTAVGGSEPPSKRKKATVNRRKSEADSPAGPGDFSVSADVCSEEDARKGAPKPVSQKLSAGVPDEQLTRTVPRLQLTVPHEQPEPEVSSDTACHLFPGRDEVQRMHLSHLESEGESPSIGTEELIFEADGEGETEAERLLNAFGKPGRIPAVVNRAGALGSTEEGDDHKQKLPAHAIRNASATPPGPSHQRGNVVPAPMMGSGKQIQGSGRGGGPQVPGRGMSPPPPPGAADSMSPLPEDGSESQRKTAIVQLITTQGVRPSELRGNWSELAQQYSSPDGRPQRPGASGLLPVHTVRTPDNVSDGPSARGPAWREATSSGQTSPAGAVEGKSPSVSLARAGSGASSALPRTSPPLFGAGTHLDASPSGSAVPTPGPPSLPLQPQQPPPQQSPTQNVHWYAQPTPMKMAEETPHQEHQEHQDYQEPSGQAQHPEPSPPLPQQTLPKPAATAPWQGRAAGADSAPSLSPSPQFCVDASEQHSEVCTRDMHTYPGACA